jgi:hypothetical protein
MKTTERQTIKPVGLARFLVAHGECQEGFETARDRRLITVICRGCDSSFSFLTKSPEGAGKEVDAALVELAEATSPERPSPNGSAPERTEAPKEEQPKDERPIHTPPAENRSRVPDRQGSTPRHRSVPPPGPLAPRHDRSLSTPDRLARSLERHGRRLIAALGRRRRPVALAALGLAGAYVLLGLTVGGEPSSSQDPESLGGTQVPVTAPPSSSSAPAAPVEPGTVAEAAVPVQTFQAGGPLFQDVVDPPQFSVALPPEWASSLDTDGSTLFGPIAGGAEIRVAARPRDDLSIGALADEAELSLTQGIIPSGSVERRAAQPAGNLLQVARATTDSAVRTAYIGLGESTAYELIAHLRKDASALVRMQAQGVLSSFQAE